MEVRQLITFRTVASTLNFARAAHVLNYVPSNITMQIQALEEELDTRLIDRLGKGIVLTESGKRFLLHVEKVLKDLEEAKLSVQESDEVTGTITISANEVILTYQLPEVFKVFRAQYPGVRIIFRPFPNELLKQSLYEGQADVIFMLDEPVVSTSLVTRTLKDEPFLLLTSPEHSLAGQKKILASKLSGEVFLLTEKGCTFRTLFDRLLERKGIEGITNMEFCSAEAIKQCAIAGLGIGFLPEIAVKSELQRGQLVSLPLDTSNLNIKTQVVWHKDKWITPAIKAFIDTVKMVLGESIEKES
ncbi:LysR family transcriptional regulator [Clostridium beijerinckii]|uniref:LysR family transcriptional regulator n=1 Tax=Clostridium beijerinckii TaxID=1520 RepID=UPI00098CB5F3|nr:LysR family transcriptional regulator [Clostridium beijerinckii]MBA8933566.1 DNA-binding transcriptional LysR family regulator [Clostridium beijerinckii]NRU37765.1 DNA-binding transcriptional LysR family regulator [Clostridium beijerinckii]NSA98957.1 DNA-binding transcriptional LysR family regulator [Clostridium beijerinckii]OOM55619.1 HTH-type transcriptional regulator GltR [Clostridium beijerinckii]OOM72542.1 HTH-type transcriptional regulator GltR [Clostridium beijerinckii]